MNVITTWETPEVQTGNTWQLPETITTEVWDERNALTGALTIESPDNKWEYLELYERQNKVAKQLNQRAKENDKKDRNWRDLIFKPENLDFDGNMVIYSEWIPFRQPYLFSIENESFKEIPILSEKTYLNEHWNWVIPVSIEKIQDGVYEVSLKYIRDHEVLDYYESYYIDKSWKILETVWKIWKFKDANGNICSNYCKENHWWFKYTEFTNYDSKWEKKSQTCTIFDENFNVLHTIENSQLYHMKYCDAAACILEFIKNNNNQQKYIIMVNWKSNLKKNEYMDKFLAEEAKNEHEWEKENSERRARNEMPFEERFKDINHCIILQNNEEHKLTITNDKEGEDKKTLIEINDFMVLNEDNNAPSIVTKDWYFIIENRNEDSDILFLKKYDKEGFAKKSVFINKNTWEKMEFDWFEWKNSFLRWKLIQVMYTWSDSEIYDEKLEKIWKKFWASGDEWKSLFGIMIGEKWNEKGYLYNTSTWKNLWEIDIDDKNFWWNVIKRRYSDDKGIHYIIRKKDGTLIEVSL